MDSVHIPKIVQALKHSYSRGSGQAYSEELRKPDGSEQAYRSKALNQEMKEQEMKAMYMAYK